MRSDDYHKPRQWWLASTIHPLLTRWSTDDWVGCILYNLELWNGDGAWALTQVPSVPKLQYGWLDNDMLSDRAGMVRRIDSYARVPHAQTSTLWFSIDIVSYNNALSRKESIMLQQISSWAKLLSYMFGTLERESTWALLKLRSKAPKRPAVNGGMLSGQCRDSPRHYSCLFICTGPTCPN